MKKISKLQLLIQEEEAKYMDVINKKNKDIYLKILGDEEYKELIKNDAILFYCKYLTENKDGYSMLYHSSYLLNKFINMESYLDCSNYNTILAQLTKNLESLKRSSKEKYFELLEQICLYKLYKYVYEVSIINNESFEVNLMHTYRYLDSLPCLGYIKGCYENKLFNEFTERLVDVKKGLKKKTFNADLMYFTYCKTTLNTREKEEIRERVTKKYNQEMINKLIRK